MKLSQEQKDVVVGTLLGDGNLQTNNNGRTWRYRALHKKEHEQYLDKKYEILKPLCTSPPVYSDIFDQRTGKTYQRKYFNTIVSSSLIFYGNAFYTYDATSNKMIKDVPVTIEKLLTPRAIAYWYMDDGNLKEVNYGNAMRICTESFSVEGVNRLRKALANYGIEHTSLNVKRNSQKIITGYRLIIREKSAVAFRDLIEPYLVPCMRYKVTDGNKGHL
jgi:recombination protein RecA